jgi:hypothetical protein
MIADEGDLLNQRGAMCVSTSALRWTGAVCAWR